MPQPDSSQSIWRCGLGHTFDEDPGDDCPHRDREDGSWCGAPVSEWIVCPECEGIPQMQGDGCGWDGTNYHTPPCGRCSDQGVVRA